MRVGARVAEEPDIVAPTAIDWPATPVAEKTAGVPVTIGAGASGAQITSVTLEGEDEADFEIRGEGCPRGELVPFARCEVTVGALPQAVGMQSAALKITDASGQVTTVQLALEAIPVEHPDPADRAAEQLAELAFATTEANSVLPARYEGLTPAILHEIDHAIQIEPGGGKPYLSAAEPIESDEGFIVTATSVTGHTFTIVRYSNGTVERPCTPIAVTGEPGGGCQNSRW